jgi:hypothetical protein
MEYKAFEGAQWWHVMSRSSENAEWVYVAEANTAAEAERIINRKRNALAEAAS